MNQSAVYPSSTHEGSAPYGYPQQPPLNQLHTGPTPSPHGNQMSAANLASSYASMAVTNAAPNAQFPTQANHHSNMSSPPPSAAYPYSSGPSPNGPVSGYLQATENNQTPHSAYAQEGYTPVNQGMGAPSYPPANPTTQGFDPNNSYNVSAPPQGFSNPSPPVNYHSPTTLPNSPPIPQSLNSPVGAQQPPTPMYSPAGGTYPDTFSPISPTGPGFAYNSPPAANAPFSPTGPPTQHMVPQFSPTIAPGPYQPSQAVPNVNPHSPPPPQQMYGQGPQMSSPTAMSPATDANKGAAADYYGNSTAASNSLQYPSIPATYPAHPHDPNNPSHPSAPGEETDDFDDENLPADGERGLGTMLFGSRKKGRKGLFNFGGRRQSAYGHGYNGQGVDPYGGFVDMGSYSSIDMSMFDHSATIQQTMMNNAVLQSQMIANSGASISNLCG